MSPTQSKAPVSDAAVEVAGHARSAGQREDRTRRFGQAPRPGGRQGRVDLSHSKAGQGFDYAEFGPIDEVRAGRREGLRPRVCPDRWTSRSTASARPGSRPSTAAASPCQGSASTSG